MHTRLAHLHEAASGINAQDSRTWQREKEKGNECMRCGEINAAVAYYSKSLELVSFPRMHMSYRRATAGVRLPCFVMHAE